MRDVINIHIGQAGIQIGDYLWELYLLEHGIDLNGNIIDPKNDNNSYPFFSRLSKKNTPDKFSPRALFIDTDPSTINEIKSNSKKKLWRNGQFISGTQSADHNYGRAVNIAKEILNEKCSESLRKMLEDSLSNQGFFITHSIGGGTGSGLSLQMLEEISQLKGAGKIAFSIFPSNKLSTSVVETYNALLAVHKLNELVDISFVMENEAVFNLCKNLLNIKRPQYRNINEIYSQYISSVTSNFRIEKDDSQFSDIRSMLDLVPYPRLHYITCGYSPILKKGEIPNLSIIAKQSTENLFTNQLRDNEIHPMAGLMCRCLNLKEQNPHIVNIRNKMAFPWSPSRLIVASNEIPNVFLPDGNLVEYPASVSFMANTSSTKSVFKRLLQNFDLLYKKKAFLHWFTMEGVEEGEMFEAREDLSLLIQDYEEIETFL